MFYTNNRFNNMAEIDVEPNMAYAHENGALVAMIEGYENERALFEAAIYTDIQEATMISEGASEEEITALQENAITSFFAKIKEFFKKLWEKIKAVFHGFVARFDAFFMKGDKLVKKYRAELMKKSLKGVDFAFDEPKSWGTPISAPNTNITISGGPSDVRGNSSKADNFEMDDEVCAAFSAIIGGGFKCSDPSDFDEEFHDFFFKGEEDVDGESIKTKVLDFLEKKDAVKNVKDLNTGLEKVISNIIKSIDKEEKEMNKNINAKTNHNLKTAFHASASGKHATDVDHGNQDKGDNPKLNVDANRTGETKAGESGMSASEGSKLINYIRKKASAYQTAITKYTSASLKEIKDLTSRSKATLARMVAAKEESTFLDALEDAVMYETSLELQYEVTVED